MNFRTVSCDTETELIINRSRFIARVASVDTDEKAIAVINEEQSRFPDATHHCYAYVIGKSGMSSRHSDDGEPSGTAGMPILDMIKGNGLTNTVVVVTRYFGGILLGTGGLVRAYSSSAKAAIEQAGVVEYVKCGVYRIELDYSLYSRFERAKLDLKVLNSEFNERVALEIAVVSDNEEQMIKRIVDICGGQLIYERLTEAFYPI